MCALVLNYLMESVVMVPAEVVVEAAVVAIMVVVIEEAAVVVMVAADRGSLTSYCFGRVKGRCS